MRKLTILKLGSILLILALVISGIAFVVSAINKPNGKDHPWQDQDHPWQDEYTNKDDNGGIEIDRPIPIIDFTGSLPPRPGGDPAILDIGWNED